jgi:hypothetical protein
VITFPGKQHAAKHDQAAMDARRRLEYYPRAKLFSEERMREQVRVGVAVGVGVGVCVCVVYSVCGIYRIASPLLTKHVFMHEANMRSMCVCVSVSVSVSLCLWVWVWVWVWVGGWVGGWVGVSVGVGAGGWVGGWVGGCGV